MTDKKTDKVMIQANGMPVRDEPSPGALKTVPFLLIPLAIGTGIAAATYKFGDTALYDRKIAAAIANDAHWGALGALLFTRAVGFVNFFPMQLKAGIVGFEGDNGPEGMNLRANPFYYKVIGEGASKDWTVIFQTDGAMGKYNRAQRSIHHMVENFGTLLITMPVVSAIFPFPTFVCTALSALGRCVHQYYYVVAPLRGVGFAMGVVTGEVLSGFALLTCVKAFGIPNFGLMN